MPDNRPNFFILGTPKAGTTALFSSMCEHPDVYPASVKETRYFCDDHQFVQGPDYYLGRYFQSAERYRLRGEATPRYLGDAAKVAPRIHEFTDGSAPRFIVVLREPIERAWSHYLHLKRSLLTDKSFEDIVQEEAAACTPGQGSFSGCMPVGLYRPQLEIWMQHFPRSSFLFLEYGAFTRDNMSVLSEVFRFLELPPFQEPIAARRRNVTGTPRSRALMRLLTRPPRVAKKIYKLLVPKHLHHELATRLRQWNVRPFETYPEVPPVAARFLAGVYRDEVEPLERMTGLDLSEWRSKYERILRRGGDS